MNGKMPLMISIFVVALATGFLVYTGLSENMVYYYPVDDFVMKAGGLHGETIKINGKADAIQKSQMDYEFLVRGSNGNQVRVTYRGVVPDTFKEGADVVVEGSYDSAEKVFRCTTLLAKCPTKYEPGETKPHKESES